MILLHHLMTTIGKKTNIMHIRLQISFIRCYSKIYSIINFGVLIVPIFTKFSQHIQKFVNKRTKSFVLTQQVLDYT